MKRYRITIFPRRDWLGRKRWYFNIRSSANSQVVAHSEAYVNRADCVATAQNLRAGLFDAAVSGEDE